MLNPELKIFIYDKDENLKMNFGFCVDIEIVYNRANLTQTATVTIPQKQKSISDKIQVGDIIEILFGYGSITQEYRGYISNVFPARNVVLKCEDEAFLYKQQSLEGLEYKNETLDSFIKKLYKGEVKIPNSNNIGTWIVDKNATLIDVLNQLKQTFNIFIYWKDGVLNVGSELDDTTQKTIILDVDSENSNVVIGTCQLEIKKADDFKPIAWGYSSQKDGTAIEVFAYFKDEKGSDIIYSTSKPKQGVLNKYTVPNQTETQIKTILKTWLPNLYSTGVAGTTQTFGEPSIKINDAVKILYKEIPELAKTYEISAVTKTYSFSGGIKQNITLGQILKK